MPRSGAAAYRPAGSFPGGCGIPQQGASDFLAKDQPSPELLEIALRHALQRGRLVAELDDSRERYRLAAEGASDGLWDWDLRANRLYFSPRVRALLGLPLAVETFTPDQWMRQIHEKDRSRVYSALTAYLMHPEGTFQDEHRVPCADGSERGVACRGKAVLDGAGRPLRMAGSQTDVTERRLRDRDLEQKAVRDSLTELPNRAFFLDRLGRALASVREGARPRIAVAVAAANRFASVQAAGLRAAEEILREAARRIPLRLSRGATVARLEGELFAVLLEDAASLEAAEAAAQAVLSAFQEPFSTAAGEIFLQASLGLAFSDPSYTEAEDLLRDAHLAHSRAVALGANRMEVFNPALRRRAADRLTLERDLRRALERGEFELHDQPIFDRKAGRPAGAEALVRWRHSERGLVPPLDFIPPAEETGLILPLGEWVLRRACADWNKSPPGFPEDAFCSVNLSAAQFADRTLPDRVRAALRESGFPPGRLKLEVTESIVMKDPEAASAVLRGLQEGGAAICVDDFGTGYSSFSHLHRLPLDVLKIDRSFVRNMAEGRDREITRTLVELAHRLDLVGVAEDVETASQRDALTAMDCDLAQGYFLAKPAPLPPPKTTSRDLRSGGQAPPRPAGSSRDTASGLSYDDAGGNTCRTGVSLIPAIPIVSAGGDSAGLAGISRRSGRRRSGPAAKAEKS